MDRAGVENETLLRIVSSDLHSQRLILLFWQDGIVPISASLKILVGDFRKVQGLDP